MNKELEVDIVYTWVDGNDPAWQKRHAAFTGIKPVGADVDCKGRYADNDELKFSLRSVEKYAPWIRRVFIITDSQVPAWLDTSNPRIKIVDHRDILPPEAIPCFNSQVLEHCMFRIPGLSEHFIYSNDDMFFNRKVEPTTFFNQDGHPIVRFYRAPLRRFSFWAKTNIIKKPLSLYNQALLNATRIVKEKYGMTFLYKSHHNIDSYLKSDSLAIIEEFIEQITPTLANHLRAENDIQRIIYSYVPIIKNRAQPEYVDKHTSFMLRIHKRDHYEHMEKYNPIFFCLNDSQYATDEDRIRARKYLEKRFPHKSQFEK